MARRDYQHGPSDRQLRYMEALARDAGLGGDAWDHFPGMSRSKAQKSATSQTASAAIEALQAKVELRAARAGLPEGSIHEDAVLIAGRWQRLNDDALQLYQELKGALAGRLDAVASRREELKAAGSATPWMDAMREVAGTDAVAARRTALEQERAQLVARLAEIDAELAQE